VCIYVSVYLCFVVSACLRILISECLYVCVSVCQCVCLPVCLHVCMSVCLCVFMPVYLCICVSCVSVHAYIFASACLCLCNCVTVCLCVCVCVQRSRGVHCTHQHAMRLSQLLQFGNTYFPSKTCNSAPGWHVSLSPETSIDYAEHPEVKARFDEGETVHARENKNERE